jgi:DNA-binding beta-propeller fold protein YncE
MQIFFRLTAVFLAASLAVLFASCAKVPKEPPMELYWPFPPQKPRIKFVDIIVGSIDVTGVMSGSVSRLLFGEEPEYRFLKPAFLAVKDDVLYVTDITAVHVYDFKKKKFHLVGKKSLVSATGVAVSEDGRIFVGDSMKNQVLIFNKDGSSAGSIGGLSVFGSVGGLAVDDANGRLMVCDTKGHKVAVYSLSGELLFSMGKRGNEKGEFNYPYSATVDPKGNIYVVDSGNFRVQIFDKDGNFISAFGSLGAVAGTFSRPKGIALDSEGHIYVVDAAFGNFQILDSEGRVFLAVGTNGKAPGQFMLPLDIAIDGRDRIFVVDQINRRIQVFQYLKDE